MRNFRLRFSLGSLLLSSALVCVSVGWLLERQHYRRLLEQEKIALVRWLPLQKVVSIAESWNRIKSEGHDLHLFDSVLRGELRWLIHEGFHLEPLLRRRGLDDSIDVSKRAAELVGCDTSAKVRLLFADLGDSDPDVYPFITNPQSEEYRRFDDYLFRMFANDR